MDGKEWETGLEPEILRRRCVTSKAFKKLELSPILLSLRAKANGNLTPKVFVKDSLHWGTTYQPAQPENIKIADGLAGVIGSVTVLHPRRGRKRERSIPCRNHPVIHVDRDGYLDVADCIGLEPMLSLGEIS